MKLSDIIFSDLYVTSEVKTSWFKPTSDSLITQTIPPECEDEILRLRAQLLIQSGNSDFRIEWPDNNGIRLRVERIPAANNETIFICRRFRLAPGPLDSLGVPPAIAQKLLAPSLKEGLVVFIGPSGAGKSTTAASFMLQRLSLFGGVGWTVENPIELPMQGKHGKGVCYQTEVSSDGDIGRSITKLYRAAPNIILIGEVRDGPAVREAIAAATSGHLVVITFHANDLITGLARLARFAGDDNANVALSDALRVAISLSLRNINDKALPGAPSLSLKDTKGTGTPPRVLSVDALWTNGEMANALRAIIKSGDYGLLKSQIDNQRRMLMNNIQ
ncbi:ATPase, T2SS/T4P/T4SS family [Methylotenera sp.]|uniref:ATPase, T2SS/T4P/T4SS family n=1 Tax=Methylotenera sp. TaxID=2051956 RepID=UPI002ED81E33